MLVFCSCHFRKALFLWDHADPSKCSGTPRRSCGRCAWLSPSHCCLQCGAFAQPALKFLHRDFFAKARSRLLFHYSDIIIFKLPYGRVCCAYEENTWFKVEIAGHSVLTGTSPLQYFFCVWVPITSMWIPAWCVQMTRVDSPGRGGTITRRYFDKWSGHVAGLFWTEVELMCLGLKLGWEKKRCHVDFYHRVFMHTNKLYEWCQYQDDFISLFINPMRFAWLIPFWYEWEIKWRDALSRDFL